MKNLHFEKIADEMLNDYIFKEAATFSIIYNQNSTLVMAYAKYPEYLLKLSNKDFRSAQIQSKILSSISPENKNICRIYHTQLYDDDGNTRTLELIDKLPGKPKYNYSEEIIKNVIQETKHLHDRINKNAGKYRNNLPSIDVLFSNIIANTTNNTLRSIGQSIQKYNANNSFLNAENPSIIVGDMVCENILFDNNTINFIDLDPLLLGPENLQFAILLTSNILIQSTPFKHLNLEFIKRYASLWGIKNFSRADLITLAIFPLLILSMKQIDVDTLPENDASMYFKLKKILFFVMAEVEDQM